MRLLQCIAQKWQQSGFSLSAHTTRTPSRYAQGAMSFKQGVTAAPLHKHGALIKSLVLYAQVWVKTPTAALLTPTPSPLPAPICPPWQRSSPRSGPRRRVCSHHSPRLAEHPPALSTPPQLPASAEFLVACSLLERWRLYQAASAAHRKVPLATLSLLYKRRKKRSLQSGSYPNSTCFCEAVQFCFPRCAEIHCIYCLDSQRPCLSFFPTTLVAKAAGQSPPLRKSLPNRSIQPPITCTHSSEPAAAALCNGLFP